MSFVPKTQAFNAKINAVTLGTGKLLDQWQLKKQQAKQKKQEEAR